MYNSFLQFQAEKEGWLSGSGWNPARQVGCSGKTGTLSLLLLLLLLLCPPSYMEEEPGGGEDVPQRGVAATATATGGLWLGALSRLSSAPTVGGNTCAGRSMQ